MAVTREHDPKNQPVRTTIIPKKPDEDGRKIQIIIVRAENKVISRKLGTQDKQINLNIKYLKTQDRTDQLDTVDIKDRAYA